MIRQQKVQLFQTIRATKRVVIVSVAFLGVVYLFLGIWMYLYPWTLVHQAAFEDTLPSSASVILAEIGSAIAVFSAGIAVLMCDYDSSAMDWKQPLAMSATLGLLMMGFWGTALFQKASDTNTEITSLVALAWRPVTPLVVPIGCAWAIDGIQKMKNNFNALVSSQYSFKRA